MIMNQLRLFTIGVYGFSEEEFFGALKNALIDTFCDVRRRRGVRGSTYAFVNSNRLQQKLAETGIRYLYLKQFAPAEFVRDLQRASDKASGVKKRDRPALSEAFVHAYESECLRGMFQQDFLNQLGPGAHNAVLFCVEQRPEACHRSILARHLGSLLGIEPAHLLP
jgi:uncharacterized protein (DUF488 family)